MVGVGVVVGLALGLGTAEVGLPVGVLVRVAVGVNRLGVGTFGGRVGKGSVGAKVGKGGVGGTCPGARPATSGVGSMPWAQAADAKTQATIDRASHDRRLQGPTGTGLEALSAGSRAASCPTAAVSRGRPRAAAAGCSRD